LAKDSYIIWTKYGHYRINLAEKLPLFCKVGKDLMNVRSNFFGMVRIIPHEVQYGYFHSIYEASTMHVTLVKVLVKPTHIEDFIVATQLNHEASIQELGNRRFDVLQSPENPAQFILYEAYVSAEAAAEHKQTTHYLTWRDTVADWMAQPRQGNLYEGLFPQG
jgi:(4S)-4-hydroxy-5-phosphonooxypentane-2,3-dione isomerase